MDCNGEFIIVKVLKGMKLINGVKVSHIQNSEKMYHILGEDDQRNIKDIPLNKNLNIIFIFFEDKNSKYEPYEIYLGKCCLILNPQDSSKLSLKYKVNYGTESMLIIKNFVLSSGIDLMKDFKDNSYIFIETSMTPYQKLLDSLSKYSRDQDFIKTINPSSHGDDPKGKLSQKNSHVTRVFSHRDNSGVDPRSEFQRDRERILHSKAFRRLVDKAQIFTSNKGDHFRTRMTHTLEVVQISRGIARLLDLNEDLTEAIALAHDIGHTPFGHQGERTLQMLLDKEIERLPEVMQVSRRFKHNFQGIRVLNYLEEKYVDFEGLNLSFQVLEGVLKHTKSCLKTKKCELNSCNHSCIRMEDFLVLGEKEFLFLQYKFPTTLEGQVVRIADEIAQRGHDLDDAFASSLLSYDEFEKICSIKKLQELKKLTQKSRDKENDKEKEGFYFIDKHNVVRAELVSSIIGFLINDVVKNSKSRIDRYDEKDELFVTQGRIKELLIDFGLETKFIVEYLENEISKKVINSKDVVVFDDSSEKIVTSLFKAYLRNPKLLPDSTLRRLFKEIKREGLDVIDFRDSEVTLLSNELERIKLYTFNPDNKIDKENEKYALKFDKLLHAIIDHISGMTDNFAINEYQKLMSS